MLLVSRGIGSLIVWGLYTDTFTIDKCNIERNMIYYGTRKIQILIVFDIAFNKEKIVLIKEQSIDCMFYYLLSTNTISLFNSDCKSQATPNLIRNNNREYTFSN